MFSLFTEKKLAGGTFENAWSYTFTLKEYTHNAKVLKERKNIDQ
jgi:hypothetical protein